jgi:NTP pyrophosphatase (non-canonical NTP hydrolase)
MHRETLNNLAADVHASNLHWWTDLQTGQLYDRNVGELLCLVHSEISEAMEGHRKDLPDDHLPHRSMFEVELADALIRILDMAGAMGLDIGGAFDEKRAYNATRADHRPEARLAAGGKRY